MEAFKACVCAESRSSGNYGVMLVPDDGALVLANVSLEKAQGYADGLGGKARVVLTDPGEKADPEAEPILFDVVLLTVWGDPEVTQESLSLKDAIEFARQFNRMQYQGHDHEVRAIVVCRQPETAHEQGCKLVEHRYDEHGDELEELEEEEPDRHVIVYDLNEIPCAVFQLDNQGDGMDDEETVANYNKLALQAEPEGAHLAVIFDGPAPTLEEARAAYEADDEDGATNRWEVVQDLGGGHEKVLRSQVGRHVAKGYAAAFEDYLKAAVTVRKMADGDDPIDRQFCLINARWESDTAPVSPLDIPEGDFEWDHDGDAMGDGLDDIYLTREGAIEECAKENAERMKNHGPGSFEGFGWMVVVERREQTDRTILRSIDTRTGEGREALDRWTDLRLVRPTPEEMAKFGAPVAMATEAPVAEAVAAG